MGDPSNGYSGSNPSNSGWRNAWAENFFSLILALLLVFMIRSSIFEAFKIPSGSMIPTLLVGDHIFVNKFAYGFKIPFSDWVLDDPIYIIKRDPPKRGDIVVFMYPKDESIYYIKRVIGTPGDVIEIRNKVLYINNQPVKRDLYAAPEADKIFKDLEDPKYSQNNLEIFTEHLDTVDHTIMLEKNNTMVDNFEPHTVPADRLFVMGDNRDFSNDSRFWGYVPYRNVKGKAEVIWLSAWFGMSSESKPAFRPERIGTLLH